MASISSVSAGTNTAPVTTATTTKVGGTAQSQENQFLQLLVAQLQSQNPLDPMDGTQFVSQLAQFSSLQEMTGMHSDLDSIQKYMQSASTTGTTTSPSNPFQTT